MQQERIEVGYVGGDDTKRYKFIKKLNNKIKSNQIITKNIYNFRSHEFVA